MEVTTFENFTLDIDEFDAISFVNLGENEYYFNIMKLRNKQNDYIVTDMGYKFTMMMRGEDDKLELNDAILGDPVAIMKNFIRAGAEGIFIKRCGLCDSLIAKIVQGSLTLKETIQNVRDDSIKI